MSTHQPNTRPSASALMTASELDGLHSELRQLRQRFSAELPEQLREARSYGDDSNNDEYHAVREEEMVLKARIQLLEDAIARAVVVDPDQDEPGVVTIGATVAIKGLNSRDKSHRYRIVSAHAIDRDVITAASPVGQAIMGAEPGTVVTVDLPGGRSRKVRVTAVEGT
jgi:transcription elongation factor GreA